MKQEIDLMALPFFYKANINPDSKIVVLDEDTSKHIVQVLRMKNGEQLQLTDGKGKIYLGEITNDHRKKCEVTILKISNIPYPSSGITIAISPVKNTSRYEWFLEKATEIGVTAIVPLLCERTEKQHFKWERMQGILVSAMLQSQQAWLPILHEPIKFSKYLGDANTVPFLLKMIAHCEDENNKQLLQKIANPAQSQLILIGPEGDFSKQEIEDALWQGFIPVSLGNSRLRTETAGIVAATLLCNP